MSWEQENMRNREQGKKNLCGANSQAFSISGSHILKFSSSLGMVLLILLLSGCFLAEEKTKKSRAEKPKAVSSQSCKYFYKDKDAKMKRAPAEMEDEACDCMQKTMEASKDSIYELMNTGDNSGYKTYLDYLHATCKEVMEDYKEQFDAGKLKGRALTPAEKKLNPKEGLWMAKPVDYNRTPAIKPNNNKNK